MRRRGRIRDPGHSRRRTSGSRGQSVHSEKPAVAHGLSIPRSNRIASTLESRGIAHLEIFKMHIIRESAGAADDAVHHLLVVAKRTVRHAEIHNHLGLALGAVARVSDFAHRKRLDSSNRLELTRFEPTARSLTGRITN